MGNGAKRILIIAVFFVEMAGVIFATFRDRDQETGDSTQVADVSAAVAKDAVAPKKSKSGEKNSAVTGPRIKFENETHDFGRTSAGESVDHTFMFKNIGSETLVIEKVKSG